MSWRTTQFLRFSGISVIRWRLKLNLFLEICSDFCSDKNNYIIVKGKMTQEITRSSEAQMNKLSEETLKGNRKQFIIEGRNTFGKVPSPQVS